MLKNTTEFLCSTHIRKDCTNTLQDHNRRHKKSSLSANNPHVYFSVEKEDDVTECICTEGWGWEVMENGTCCWRE